MLRSAFAVAVLGSVCWLASPSSAETVEFFVLWGLRGRYDGTLTVEQGRLVKVEPFSFEPQYGDVWRGADERRASWKSGVGGQVDGIHIIADAGPDTRFHLDTAACKRVLAWSDFPVAGEQVTPLEGADRHLIIGRGDPALGPRSSPEPEFSLPPLFSQPVPRDAVALPDDWYRRRDERLRIRLSAAPAGELRVRRVSRSNTRADGDGRLYLEVTCSSRPLSGQAQVSFGEHALAERALSGELWLSLCPRYGWIELDLVYPNGDGDTVTTLRTASVLVETRGAKLYLNGEPFLVKGTLPRDLTDEDAAYLKELGANTLRHRPGLGLIEKHGFMTLKQVHYGPGHICKKPFTKEEFLVEADKYMTNVRRIIAQGIDTPDALILQLGNEQTGNFDPWVTFLAGIDYHSRLDVLLARVYNEVKPICPMIPCGYSNNLLTYTAPDFLEVYEHNTYLSEDRGWPPVGEFMKQQGTEPVDGWRPWIMSEWGANVYMPEAYRLGPLLPVLEKIHAWNYPNRWRTYTRAGVNGGTNYCLYDYSMAKARKMIDGEWDKGFRLFGVMTTDRLPKLALWELWHLWRDFEVSPSADGTSLRIKYGREYTADDCRLTLEVGTVRTVSALGAFAANSARVIPSPAAGEACRWRMDYSTHGGLPMSATGGWPDDVEARMFFRRLGTRSTFPFLKELFDTRIAALDGSSDFDTLADIERADGVVGVVFVKPDRGTAYLTVFHRQRPKTGSCYDGVSVDVSFRGEVTRVDELTGEPMAEPVETAPTDTGMRLINLRVPYWGRHYTSRATEPLEFPVYKISNLREHGVVVQ